MFLSYPRYLERLDSQLFSMSEAALIDRLVNVGLIRFLPA
jgi:hypothetical protein